MVTLDGAADKNILIDLSILHSHSKVDWQLVDNAKYPIDDSDPQKNFTI